MMPRAISLAEIRKFFRLRNPNSHKGQNGRVLIIAGSDELAGAAALSSASALSCLRSGIDLCTIAAPEKTAWLINKYSPDLIVTKLSGKIVSQKHVKRLLELAKNCDSILIGPGMGREIGTLKAIRKFVEKCPAKMVLDADALHACAGMKFARKALITPHTKEFGIFTGFKAEGKTLAQKIALAKNAAQKFNCTVLLKGRVDVITDGKKMFLNKTGNARMTVGGTGDVLAGISTAFLALGADFTEAGAAAAFVNGKIGDSLFKKMGYSYIASDFLGEIPKWIKKILK